MFAFFDFLWILRYTQLTDQLDAKRWFQWRKNLDQIMHRLPMLILPPNTAQVATAVQYITKHARIL